MSERECAEEVWLCESGHRKCGCVSERVGRGSVAVSEREKVGRGSVVV